MITSCPNCNSKFEVDDAMAGHQVRCSSCQHAFTIGASSAAPSAGRVRAPNPGPSVLGLGGAGRLETGKLLLLVGKFGIFVGLIFVVFSRGCDSVGNRGVARKIAAVKEGKDKFNEKWDREAAKRGLTSTTMDAEDDPDRAISVGRARPPSSYEDMRELERKREEYRKTREEEMKNQREKRLEFEKEKDKERKELEKGEWLDLESEARGADADNTMAGYWHEWLFLIGSLGLIVGALTVAFGGTGAERIVCLIMVALVVFSIYVGGVAWAGSIINNVKGVR